MRSTGCPAKRPHRELGYALEALSHSTNEASEYLNQVLNYLSTHPALDRIHEAIEAGTMGKITQSGHDG